MNVASSSQERFYPLSNNIVIKKVVWYFYLLASGVHVSCLTPEGEWANLRSPRNDRGDPASINDRRQIIEQVGVVERNPPWLIPITASNDISWGCRCYIFSGATTDDGLRFGGNKTGSASAKPGIFFGGGSGRRRGTRNTQNLDVLPVRVSLISSQSSPSTKDKDS